MNANELADELEYWFGNAGFAEHVAMLRQQQAEIEFLKKEILAKHEDWKHEGQQAANAKAEIEALKKHNEGWKEDFIKQGIKLEKLKSELVIANAMLDSYEWCKK